VARGEGGLKVNNLLYLKNQKFLHNFETFVAVKIHTVVFWAMTLFSGVAGYQCFRGSCCLHPKH